VNDPSTHRERPVVRMRSEGPEIDCWAERDFILRARLNWHGISPCQCPTRRTRFKQYFVREYRTLAGIRRSSYQPHMPCPDQTCKILVPVH
jgi:hypothetical protein